MCTSSLCTQSEKYIPAQFAKMIGVRMEREWKHTDYLYLKKKYILISVELHAAYLERLRNFLEHETHSSAPAGSSSTPTPTDHLTANNSAR